MSGGGTRPALFPMPYKRSLQESQKGKDVQFLIAIPPSGCLLLLLCPVHIFVRFHRNLQESHWTAITGRAEEK